MCIQFHGIPWRYSRPKIMSAAELTRIRFLDATGFVKIIAKTGLAFSVKFLSNWSAVDETRYEGEDVDVNTFSNLCLIYRIHGQSHSLPVASVLTSCVEYHEFSSLTSQEQGPWQNQTWLQLEETVAGFSDMLVKMRFDPPTILGILGKSDPVGKNNRKNLAMNEIMAVETDIWTVV